MNYSNEEFFNSRLCSQCNGKCCKNVPCFFMPEDFKKITYFYLKKQILESNYITIVEVTNSEGVPFYFLRIKRVNEKTCVNKKKGECMLLTENGCKLSFKERPSGGKAVIPSEDGCKSMFTVQDVTDAWMPYRHMLKRLYCNLKKEG